jgi:hypothetical protein
MVTNSGGREFRIQKSEYVECEGDKEYKEWDFGNGCG